MDRSLEMRLRMDISNFMRNSNSAGRELDGLAARAAAADAAISRVEASSRRSADAMRDTRVQAGLLGRDFNRTSTEIDRARRSLDDFNNTNGRTSAGAATFSRNTQRTSNDLNQFTGRLGLAADAILALWPALIPIGALAGQATAGLVTLGLSGAAAAGSLVVAFQGVIDTIGAVQDFQDDPTWDNAKAAREELDKLAPSARRFVMEFQRARPIFADIRDAAADGWFPGLTDALDKLDVLAPKLEDIMFTTGRMGGMLTDQSVDALASDRWAEFFDYLERELPSAEASLFRILGSLGHGLAEMWMGFDSGNDSFIGWLEDQAETFDRWAQSAEAAEGIEDFLAYARANGPTVEEFFSTVGSALLGIIQAGSELGGPTLQVLTAIADVFAQIANSDIAAPILLGLTALRLFNRAQLATAAASSRMAAANSFAYGGTGGTNGGTVSLFGALSAQQRARMTAADQAARAAAQRRAIGVGAGGALAGGLLASGAAQELELTNTAMLALMGTMGGPWGVALGAAAGFALDAAKANNDLTESYENAEAALASGNLVDGMSKLAEARKAQADFEKDMDPNDWANALSPGFYKNTIEKGLGSIGIGNGSDIDDGKRALADLEAEARNVQSAYAGLADVMGISVGPLDGSTRSVEALQAALEKAKPAMDALGVSEEDLIRTRQEQTAREIGGGSWSMKGLVTGRDLRMDPYDRLTSRIERQQRLMDSAAGRAEHYSAVLLTLSTSSQTAAEKADAFRLAMEALVDPALDAEEALSRQREILKSISELNPEGGFTVKNEVGRTNLSATRDYTRAVQERIATMINEKRSEEDIARALKTSREQLIQSGVAAGFSAEQMRKRADAIGLTPKLIETTFRTLNLDHSSYRVQVLAKLLKGLPYRVVTAIDTEGVPESMADAKRMANEFDLTAKQRKVLFTLVDQASGKAHALGQALDQAARDRSATITVRTNYARGAGGVDPTTGGNAPGPSPKKRADGGLITGPGGPKDDQILALLSNREYVQQAASVDYYGVGLMDALNARRIPRDALPRFADGGSPKKGRRGGWLYTGLGTPGETDAASAIDGFTAAIDRATRMWKGHEIVLKGHAKALQKATDAAVEEAEARRAAAQSRLADARALRTTAGGSLSLAELTGGGLAGFDLGVAANRNDTVAGRAALKRLRAKGLGGKNDTGDLYQFLAASGDLDLLQQFAGLSRAEIREREKNYGALERAQGSLGDQAVLEQYGRSIDSMTATVKTLTRELREFRQLDNRLERAVERGARKGTSDRKTKDDRDTSTRTRMGR